MIFISNLQDSQETIYQHSSELKRISTEKSTMERNLTEVNLALDSLRLEKDSLVLDLFEQTKYKDEVEILRKEKERLSEKADALWKEVKDHQDLGTAKVLYTKYYKHSNEACTFVVLGPIYPSG